jgi:hypothetical protein
VTSLVSNLTLDLIRTGTSVGTGVDAVAAILVVLVLMERELLRAYESPSWTFQARTLDNAVLPLLMMFVVVVIAHMAEFL